MLHTIQELKFQYNSHHAYVYKQQQQMSFINFAVTELQLKKS